jgi:hypothetical protein
MLSVILGVSAMWHFACSNHAQTIAHTAMSRTNGQPALAAGGLPMKGVLITLVLAVALTIPVAASAQD